MTENLDLPAATVVTGSSGWLGRSLLYALTGPGPWARPGRIRAVVHRAVDILPVGRISPRIEPVLADVTRPESLVQVFDGTGDGADRHVDVLHAAGVIHPPDVATFDAVNHRGTRHLLEAARRAGVRRFVHVSSNSPFGTNPVPQECFRVEEPYAPYLGYGWSKMEAEVAVTEAIDAGLDAVIVRPPWFYGPHQPARQSTFFTMVRTGRFPIIGNGAQRRSMCYVDHLVQGVIRAELIADPPRRAWWVADPEPYTLVHIVDTVAEALRAEGLEVTDDRRHIPALVGRVAEGADRFLQSRGRYVSQVHVLGELDKTIAVDVTAAIDELGFRPEVGLLEGMRRSIRWCLERGDHL